MDLSKTLNINISMGLKVLNVYEVIVSFLTRLITLNNKFGKETAVKLIKELEKIGKTERDN